MTSSVKQLFPDGQASVGPSVCREFQGIPASVLVHVSVSVLYNSFQATPSAETF